MKRSFGQQVLPVVFCVLFAASTAYCSTYFVATDGNDSNDGTIDSPFQTIGHAVDTVVAGDTIYVRGGTYSYNGSSTAITLPVESGSSPTNRCSLIGYNGERALLDFSAMPGTSSEGLKITGSYWYVKGFDCKGAPHNGIQIYAGTFNTVEFCSSYENRNSGVQIKHGAANNQIINCDSYHNYDAPTNGGNADGFSPKLDVGTGNYFYGCRSWGNSDDGYDGYLTISNEVNTTYDHCWAFKNGWYWRDGSTDPNMNGNGFKMGSSTNNHNIILKNCLSFQNKAKGFDQNHNKGSMTLYNCTAYGNGGANFSIYDTLTAGKTATVKNCVAYTGGSNNLGSFVVQATNSWSPSFDVNSADFVSIDPCSAYGARKADGSLPDINFMHLTGSGHLVNTGTNVGLPYHGTLPDLGYFEYGGCTTPFASDFNSDCEVDFLDYAVLAEAWRTSPPDVDLNNDGVMDYFDLAQFADEWLSCNRDPASECWK